MAEFVRFSPGDAGAAIEWPRLSQQCEAIFDVLRRGPATNSELAQISLKYTGRISEIRRALRPIGLSVEVTQRDRTTGLTVYELVRFPP